VPTGIFNQGLPTVDRSPAPLLWRPSGWADNMFYCPLAELSGDALTTSVFVQTASHPVPLFLFTQDAPCVVSVTSRYAGVQIVDSNADTLDVPHLHFFEASQQVGNTDAAPISDIITAAGVVPIDAEEGERITGATATNAVTVSGYAYEIPIADQSLQDSSQDDVEPSLHAFVIAQSGVCAGPNSTGAILAYDGAGVAHVNRAAVILQESDYTAAMRAAGNVYTDTNGLIFRIMGIHAISQAL